MRLVTLATLGLAIIGFALCSSAHADPLILTFTGTAFGAPLLADFPLAASGIPDDATSGVSGQWFAITDEPINVLIQPFVYPSPGQVYPFTSSFNMQVTLSGLNGNPGVAATETLSGPISGSYGPIQSANDIIPVTVSGSAVATNLILQPGVTLSELPSWFPGMGVTLHAVLRPDIPYHNLYVDADLIPGSPQNIPEPSSLLTFAGVALAISRGFSRRKTRRHEHRGLASAMRGERAAS